MTPPAADSSLVEKVAVANRILYRVGVVDGFGHVSARHDKSAVHFLLARNMAPALVKREDILVFDLDGNALDAPGQRVYVERFIHGEIYRARPDVQAVVHSHSPSVIPFIDTRALGTVALWVAAILTLWSMFHYLRLAAPHIRRGEDPHTIRGDE